MKLIFYFFIFVIYCINHTKDENMKQEEPKSNFQKFLNFIVKGFRNFARIGRIFKFEKVFAGTAPEKLDEFYFSEKERTFLYKLAQLSYQTYKIGDFDSQQIENEYHFSINQYLDENKIWNKKNINSESFTIFSTKTAFITNSLKGIIYTSGDTTAIAFKGTSLSILGFDSSNTSRNDKSFNNIIFNCKPDITQMYKMLYIEDAKRIYLEVRERFPNNKIILTGHSMGATIASIVGHIVNEYVVAFASPGDRKIITSLNLPENKIKEHKKQSVISNLFHRLETNTIHIGDCGDSIYRGVCDGNINICKLIGYNIKTRCHSGKMLCFNKNQNLNVFKHPIFSIIYNLSNKSIDFSEIDQSQCENTECQQINKKLLY